MKCVACGCEREIMLHGHYQCEQCGNMMDGDCCHGETEESNVRMAEGSKERTDTNFEASDY